jgi:hypothetical protein
MKNEITSSGIQPETFQLLEQRLNALSYRVPIYIYIYTLYLTIQRRAFLGSIQRRCSVDWWERNE